MTAGDRGIALHEDAHIATGPDALHRFPNGVEDSLRFIRDDQDVRSVVGLEFVRIVRGKADRIALIAEFQFRSGWLRKGDAECLRASAISPHITFTCRKVGAVVMTSDSGQRQSAHNATNAEFWFCRQYGTTSQRQAMGGGRRQNLALQPPWVLAQQQAGEPHRVQLGLADQGQVSSKP
jgi:hypothetical protein